MQESPVVTQGEEMAAFRLRLKQLNDEILSMFGQSHTAISEQNLHVVKRILDQRGEIHRMTHLTDDQEALIEINQLMKLFDVLEYKYAQEQHILLALSEIHTVLDPLKDIRIGVGLRDSDVFTDTSQLVGDYYASRPDTHGQYRDFAPYPLFDSEDTIQQIMLAARRWMTNYDASYLEIVTDLTPICRDIRLRVNDRPLRVATGFQRTFYEQYFQKYVDPMATIINSVRSKRGLEPLHKNT